MKSKRMVMLCCLVIILLASVFALASEAAPIDVVSLNTWEGKTPLVRSQCAWQSGLALLLEKEGLYLFQPQTQTLEKRLDWDSVSHVQWLVSGGDHLWGYHSTMSTLHQLLPQVEVPPQIHLIDHPMEESQDSPLMPEQLLIASQHLFALFRHEEFNGYKTRLTAWRLTDGLRVDVLQPEHLQAFSAYEGGQLLGLVMDAWTAANTADVAAHKPNLVAFDPFTGQEQSLGILNEAVQEHGLVFAWDERDGGIYYNSKNVVIRREGSGQEAKYAYLSNDVFFPGVGDSLVPLPNQRCAVLGHLSQALLYSALQEDAHQPLSIYGLPAQDQAHFHAIDTIKGSGVVYIERNWDDDTFLPKLLQNEAVDLLFLHSSWDEVAHIVKKGYLMDLSQSDVLSHHIKRCYPFLAEQAVYSGGLYLQPVSLDAMVHTLMPEQFKALGLAVPTTFDELCDLIQRWDVQFKDDHPDVLPYSAQNPVQAMMYEARIQGLSAQILQGTAPRFDTPLLRSLMTRAAELQVDDLIKPEGDRSWYQQDALISPSNYSLSSLTMSMIDGPMARKTPVVIKPSTQQEGTVPCQVGYLAISASTKNPEAALRYAEGYLSSLHDEMYIRLYPDENKPLEHPISEGMIQKLKAAEQDLLQQLDQADEAQASNLNEQLLNVRWEIELQEAMRYSISPEVIAQYRQDMQTAFVYDRALFQLLNSKEFVQPFERFLHGNLSLDDFLNESDSKLNLMRRESESSLP